MEPIQMSRRTLLKQGGVALTGWALLNTIKVGAAPAVLAQSGVEVLPWLGPEKENRWAPVVSNQLEWEKLDSWTTPPDQFFSVSRFGNPEIDVDEWQLEITGLVDNPMTLTMADLLTWPRQEIDFTMECSGNDGFEWLWGCLATRWGGVPLAPLLQEAGIKDDAVEVAFYGADSGEITIANRLQPNICAAQHVD
ncbi:MAG: molybdopterin-dependent oxidoreductase [Caldilineaceae bacterium]